MDRRSTLAVLFSVSLVVGASCSSSSSSSSSPCESVCACVGNAHGDQGTCLTQCNQVESTSKDQRGDCLNALKSFGFTQCNDQCNAFPAGDGSGTDGGTGTDTGTGGGTTDTGTGGGTTDTGHGGGGGG